jgi:precorrin-6B methylase 2
MTVTNMDFNQHVCYHPMAELERSIVDGKPHGMAVLGGEGTNFYRELPHLPEVARESWYAFDHLYSDTSYPLILPIVLSSNPKTIADIGTNTGKFAVVLAQADPDIAVTIIDLPDQLENAKATAAKAGYGDRITPVAMDLLKHDQNFPEQLDVYWMSQFLSCFGADEVISILSRVNQAMKPDSRVFIMETCWDRQQHEAAAFSLVNTSPYFTCIASGNSKMYHSEELILCVEAAGLEVVEVTDNLGICHSLFECRRKLT